MHTTTAAAVGSCANEGRRDLGEAAERAGELDGPVVVGGVAAMQGLRAVEDTRATWYCGRTMSTLHHEVAVGRSWKFRFRCESAIIFRELPKYFVQSH